uniref:Replicase polyprotein 1ab n=1 Tax=Davidia involucrata TaxID=16924 RepID=A0A5B6YYL7_DAVIN
MATSLPWHPLLPSKSLRLNKKTHRQRQVVHPRHVTTVQAFRRSDFDGFAKRMASGEVWRNAWRSANDGFEQLLYETKKTAERIDRRYSVSHRLSLVARSAADRARELDRDFEITQRWRIFTLDFSRNLPRYRKQLNDFLDTPLGRSFATIFFLWFALSGWLFRFLIFATWILPFAGPLLIGTVANNFVIKGACPACKRQFVGYKNQIIRCANCGSIVWQPQGDSFSRGSGGRTPSSKSKPDIIDVEFEEK